MCKPDKRFTLYLFSRTGPRPGHIADKGLMSELTHAAGGKLARSEMRYRSGIGKSDCFVAPSSSRSNPGQGQTRYSSQKGKMQDRSCEVSLVVGVRASLRTGFETAHLRPSTTGTIGRLESQSLRDRLLPLLPTKRAPSVHALAERF
jgi:hypothetical protein